MKEMKKKTTHTYTRLYPVDVGEVDSVGMLHSRGRGSIEKIPTDQPIADVAAA